MTETTLADRPQLLTQPVEPPDLPGDATGPRDTKAHWQPDAAALLSLVCALLFVLPSRLVVPGLGAAGRPANILGFVLFVMWCFTRLVPGLAVRRRNPAHLVLGLLLGYTALSWWLAYARGVQPAEGRSADRFVIEIVSLVGIALTAADGLATRRRLEVVLVRLCYFAGVMAAVGTVEFFTRINVASYIKVPGLRLNADVVALKTRGGGGYGGSLFARVAGTALHYIEFGAVLAICLPIALHFALYSQPGRQRRFRWCLVALLFINLPFAISRSAIVGLMIVALTMMTVWRPRMLGRAIIGLAISLVGFKLLVPGLIGTIRSLFTNLNNDPSIKGRTSDYAVITPLIHARPWLGRGGGTYIPSLYRVLDNQYLGTLIEWGFVGLAVLVVVFLTPAFFGRAVRRHAVDDEARHLGQSITAAALVGVVLSGTFDSLSFPTFSACFFLLVGASAALWRTTVVERQPSCSGMTPDVIRQPFDVGRLLPETARKATQTAVSGGRQRDPTPH